MITCWCQMQDSSGLLPFTSALPIFVSQNSAFFFPKTSFTNCSNISPKPPTKCQKVTLVPSLSSFEDFHPEGPALHSGKGAIQNLGGSGWVPTLSIMTCSYLSIFFSLNLLINVTDSLSSLGLHLWRHLWHVKCWFSVLLCFSLDHLSLL